MLLGQAIAQAEPSPTPLVGQQIAEFALPDSRGRTHRLSDYADSQLVVVAVLGTECPLAKLYVQRLVKLADRYRSQRVVFLGLNANRQDTLAEMAVYARSFDLQFPLLKDQSQPGVGTVVDQLAATRTPEVFVLDANRHVRYRGRIDDQYAPGVSRPQATRDDLSAAIDELLAGRAVSQPVTTAVGCFIGREPRPTSTTPATVTYSNQIARLFNERCVECHRAGEIGPFALTSYDEAVSWADTIAEVVDQQRMPPWFAAPEHGKFANDARLTAAERQLLHDWVAAGCPAGDPAQLPTPRQFVSGWRIPQPDEIHYMRAEPFNVPAEGEVKYQYFIVDPGWKEDKWVQYAEARPGDRSVVHHILVLFKNPKADGRNLGVGGGETGGLVGYAPGLPPARYPEGAALHVPAGSKIIFQLHYTPNGRATQDRSYAGFKFLPADQVKQRIVGGQIGTHRFQIPPGASNHEVQAEVTLPADIRLLTMTPHMHLRGKSFRYEAVFPDGRRETLLDIPRWDFNWQLRYDPANQPVLPKGTRLIATAHYDNSTGNPSNPDPKATVRWGDQTWEEMMLGYFTALPADPNTKLTAESLRQRPVDELQRAFQQVRRAFGGE